MKKQLSVFLFGALLLGAAGTFTSCKDYDDDIANLQGQINENAAAIKALQDKVNEGKWITGISAIEGGFTVTFSDGQSFTIVNGKDGAQGPQGEPGAGGAAGTEWTISEDGYWVCNGEKTDVKAVGKDGKDGEDAKPEVLYENGQWKLWNGTEYVAVDFGGSAPAQNMPYYYVDPNDQNYAILVVYDKDGKNPTELRLPLNEGLAQLVLLNDDFAESALHMEVNYAAVKTGVKWDGPKTLPATGNIVTTNFDHVYVQVTPANYDLAALKLKFVNGEGKDVPVTVGTPQPVALTKAVSKTGVYEIPIEINTTSDEGYYKDAKRMSLYANESVRSTYTSTFQLNNATSGVATICAAQGKKNPYDKTSYTATPGKPYTIAPLTLNEVDLAAYIYDSYLTVKDDQENKAKALKWGIEIDGMTVKSTSAANGSIKLVAHYVDVVSYVGTNANGRDEITLNFQQQVQQEEDVTLASVEHTMSINKNKTGSETLSLSGYLLPDGTDERTLWNNSHRIIEESVAVDYSYTDENFALQQGHLSDAVKVTPVKANGGAIGSGEAGMATLSGLKLTFDYAKFIDQGVDLVLGYDVEFTATVNVQDANGNPVQRLYIPFKVNAPADTELPKHYTFNSLYYDADAAAFKVVGTEVTLDDVFLFAKLDGFLTTEFAESFKPNNGGGYYGYDSESATVTFTGGNGDYGKKCGVMVAFDYAGHLLYDRIDIIFVKQNETSNYTFTLSDAISVTRGGSPVKVKVGALTKDEIEAKTYAAGLTIADAAGNTLDGITITNVDLKDGNTYVDVDETNGATEIIVKPLDIQIAKNTTFNAEITFTDSNIAEHTTSSKAFVTVVAQ